MRGVCPENVPKTSRKCPDSRLHKRLPEGVEGHNRDVFGT